MTIPTTKTTKAVPSGATAEDEGPEEDLDDGADLDNGSEDLGDEAKLPERAREALRKKNSENRSLRQRLKEAEGKLSTVAELETTAQEATTRAEEAEEALARIEVGLEYGLDAKQSARLRGSTREELEADAVDLLATWGKPNPKGEGEPQEGEDGAQEAEGEDGKTSKPEDGKPQKVTSSRPAEDLAAGGDPTREPPQTTDPRQLADKVGRGSQF